MKRVLFSLLAMFAVGSLWAQSTVTETDLSDFSDAFYNPATEVVPGKEALLPIYMKSSAALTGCQVSIVLPDGVEFVEVGELNANRYVKNGILEGNVKDGVLTIFGAVVEDHGFYAGDDLLGYIKIKVSENKDTGEYPVVYKNATMSGRRNVTDGVDEDNKPIAIVEKLDEVAISQEVTSKIIVTDRITLDEDATEVPAAAENVNVKVKRTIKANTWSTLCLPFDMTAGQFKSAFGDEAKLAIFSDYEVDGGEVNPSPTTSSNAKSIVINFEIDNLSKGFYANSPYIIKTTKDIESFNVDGVTIAPDEESAVFDYNNGKSGPKKETYGYHYGTLHAGGLIPENGLFLGGSDGKFYYSVGKTKIKAFRGYFVLNDILADKSVEAGSKMFINVDGETTAIEGINTNQRVVEGVYDLQGRKVMVKDGDINNLQRGLYIINGKKVAIK